MFIKNSQCLTRSRHSVNGHYHYIVVIIVIIVIVVIIAIVVIIVIIIISILGNFPSYIWGQGALLLLTGNIQKQFCGQIN